MSKVKNVSKAVSYRRCEISPKHGQNLQQLVSAAISRFPKPADRYEPLNTASTELRCIGTNSTVGGCLCGYMTTFERGAVQPVVSDDPLAASLRLGALAPPAPTKGNAQQQYVPGVLYFAIRANHIAIVQSHSMRSRSFEYHLNWLLKSKTNLLPSTSGFSLPDEAQKATKEKIKKSHIKAIAIGEPLMAQVGLEMSKASDGVPADGAGRRKSKPTSKFKPRGRMLDFIRGYFDDDKDFEKLGLDEVFDGNLEVWVEIRYPKRKRNKPEDAVGLMDKLGIALRDLEGEQVSLELANGHRVSGNELKISGEVSVPVLSNKLPDESTLFEQMAKWLNGQIKDGVVDP